MNGLNKCLLIGNLGGSPEHRTLESGTEMTTFSLATTKTFKKDGVKQSQTEWHNIVMFGNLAGIAVKYLSKGDPVFIEGELKTRKWEDKNNVTKYTTEIIARELNMLGSKSEGKQRDPNQTSIPSPPPGDDPVEKSGQPYHDTGSQDDDDLPF